MKISGLTVAATTIVAAGAIAVTILIHAHSVRSVPGSGAEVSETMATATALPNYIAVNYNAVGHPLLTGV